CLGKTRSEAACVDDLAACDDKAHRRRTLLSVSDSLRLRKERPVTGADEQPRNQLVPFGVRMRVILCEQRASVAVALRAVKRVIRVDADSVVLPRQLTGDGGVSVVERFDDRVGGARNDRIPNGIVVVVRYTQNRRSACAEGGDRLQDRIELAT